jgi:glutamate N-acetyltransferase/amino-acid N-acetyltransferase
MSYQLIEGGVTAPIGFKASGIYCGIRKNKNKRDLALILSETKAASAAVYTTNLVKGAPLTVTKQNLSDGYAQAIICNSGNANTCNDNGIEIAEQMCELVALHTDVKPNDVIVASTGVIGQKLTIDPIRDGMADLVKNLGINSEDAANAIMTTDTKLKQISLEFDLPQSGKTARIGAIAKGSGMINPQMATMLIFVTSDIAITPELLQKALSEDVIDTFNMITVDGDTSTNDMLSIMANGLAGNPVIDSSDSPDYDAFKSALNQVTQTLSKAIAKDGEGATKLIEIAVSHAPSKEVARKVAKTVAGSSLVKAAMFGEDANWGRVLCAIGYSGCDIEIETIDVSFRSSGGYLPVCVHAAGIDFDEDFAKEVLSPDEITIEIDLGSSEDFTSAAWGCDLTLDYVRINADYRT